MATSNILGADRAPMQAEGRDVEALGPSDTSDSGSDVQGELDLASPTDLDDMIFGTVQPGLNSDTDSGGTGERGAALPDEDAHEGADILPDRVQSLGGAADEFDDGATEAELDLVEHAPVDEATSDDMPEDEDPSTAKDGP